MLKPLCPYASAVQGVAPGFGGIICAVMREDSRIGDEILEGKDVGVYLSEKGDPRTIHSLCCGTEAPTTQPGQVRAHYSSCPVYQAHVEAEEERRRTFVPLERPDTGVSRDLIERQIFREENDLTPAELGGLVAKG